MNKQRIRYLTAGLVAVALLAACGSDDDSGTESSSTEAETDGTEAGGTDSMGECEELVPVSLQLQWFTQAQFAGYFAAQDKGFYEDLCLDVTIVEGGVEIVPQTQLANGDVDFALAWVPKALASREAGADIVNIAQIYQRSGTLQVSFVEQDITTPEDFAGKKIGNWGFGNEYEVFAAITKAGLDPAADVELVGQQFDMLALLNGEIDAAEAMTYNEYAQVLESVNPDTGELYQPEDFNVISYEDIGVGMLQDAIWADAARLAANAARLRDQRIDPSLTVNFIGHFFDYHGCNISSVQLSAACPSSAICCSADDPASVLM
jgi:NitT/TauT family transport system substrate-binding protein